MNKQDILTAIKFLKIATEKTGSQGTDCFIFKDKMCYTFNVRILATRSIDIGFDEPIVVNSDDFLSAINSIKGGEVFLTKEDNSLIIKGKSKTIITLALKEEHISQSITTILPSNPEWELLSTHFYDTLKLLLLPCNSTQAKQLDGIYFDGSNAISSDTQVLLKATLPEALEKLWLSSKNVKDIISNGEQSHYFLQDSWFHTKDTQENQLSCRKLNESAYPYEFINTIIESVPKDSVFISNENTLKALTEMLRNATIFSDGSLVTLRAIEDTLVVKSESSKNSFEDSMNIELREGNYKVDAKRLIMLLEKEGMKSFGLCKTDSLLAVINGEYMGVEWIGVLDIEEVL